jgi:D-alanyl-D-alanine dipeptidase
MNFKPDFKFFAKKEKVQDFRTLPIEDVSPELQEKFKNKEWRKIPITESITAEPKHLEVVSNIPISGQAMAWPAYYKTVKEGLENDGEPKGIGELAQKIEGGIQSSPIVKIRAELKFKLDEAQKMFDNDPSTSNLQLVLVDGYRKIGDQRTLFEAYHLYVKSEHPGLSELESRSLATKMVSEPPKDAEILFEILKNSPPPHSTGGSADVVLVFKDKIDIDSDYWVEKAMVPFGAQFDEMMHPTYGDERSETSFYEKKGKEENLSIEDKKALEYRRILYHTLAKLGLTNYYTEFWHYDFGNQFNALMTGKKSAQFGFAGSIENNQIKEDLTAEREAYEAYSTKVGSFEAGRVKRHFGL